MKINEKNEEKQKDSFSIYIHFPYCKRKCPYCDFNTYVVEKIPEEKYVEDILSELDYRVLQENWLGRRVSTIFFGGGTPSLLSSLSIEKIIKKIIETFPNSKIEEVTLETNPLDLSIKSLEKYLEAGIDRISFGVQSFQDKFLKILGREHTEKDSKDAIKIAKLAGFKNISIDLIYGIPNQTVVDLEEDLKFCRDEELNHVSAYNLTIEKGTPFYEQKSKGRLILPLEEEVLEMMDLIEVKLEEYGYKKYEISNYAKEGYKSKHNLVYWNLGDYLGLGAGAHSYNNGTRSANLANTISFSNSIKKLRIGKAWQEELNIKDQSYEFWFLGLRKSIGVRKDEFIRYYGGELYDLYRDVIFKLTAEGFLAEDLERVWMTKKGVRIFDSVLEKLLLE